MPIAANIEVLIVDDQRAMRSLVRTSLHELGFKRMIECEDGAEARELLLTKRVQLIFSDFNMPNLDGLGLLRAVRANPVSARTAFIMLTSRADAHLVQEAVALGVNNYLVKPFTIAGLKKKIEAVLGPLT